jgi:WD40 repeat protein
VRDLENGDRIKIVLRQLADQSIVDVISDVGDEKSDPIDLEWSSDGQSILYVIRRSGEYELWKHSLSSKKHALVAKLGSEPIERVTVSPDGRSIATVRGSWLHDAFLITGLKY